MNEEENDSEREKEERERHGRSQEEREVAKELLLSNGNGVANGVHKAKKIDWEIPRKVLHSSIGTLFRSLSLVHSVHTLLLQDSSLSTYTFHMDQLRPLSMSYRLLWPSLSPQTIYG